jgi:methionyl-tRNA synthetase
MLHQLFDGVVPEVLAVTEADSQIETHRSGAIGPVLEEYEQLRFSEALQRIWALIGEANRYIDERKPWELRKNPERRDEVSTVFNRLLNLIRTVLLLSYPVIPDAANHFWGLLGLGGVLEEQRRDALGALIPAGHRVNPSEPYFRRIDVKQALGDAATVPEQAGETLAAAQTAPAAGQAAAALADEGLITIDDFTKVELRVARVKLAERVENADKLLRVLLDDGEWYDPAELAGRLVVLVANLRPRQLRGMLSEGMLLAASDAAGRLALVAPEQDVDPGAVVR